MIIGIDAKAISKTYTGIAVYVHEMINWFCIIAPENEYVLFSNRDFVMPKEWKSCKKVIYDAKTTGSIAILYGFKKLVKKYHIDVGDLSIVYQLEISGVKKLLHFMI